MRKLLVTVVIVLLGLALCCVVYLGFAFVMWDYDVIRWGGFARTCMLGVCLLILAKCIEAIVEVYE